MKNCEDCWYNEILSGKGNGKCANCYGTGYEQTPYAEDLNDYCLTCNGSGDCQTCDGEGEIEEDDDE